MQESGQSKPTCGTVIKRIFKERVCAEPAVDLLTLVDPENQTTVRGILLICKKHSKDLEHGKKLSFIAEDKDGKPAERIAIQFSGKQNYYFTLIS